MDFSHVSVLCSLCCHVLNPLRLSLSPSVDRYRLIAVRYQTVESLPFPPECLIKTIKHTTYVCACVVDLDEKHLFRLETPMLTVKGKIPHFLSLHTAVTHGW